MRFIRWSVVALMVMFAAQISSRPAQAQVSFGVNIGTAPACPYGYYGYAPYRCAPYGYYGPEWFTSGVFVGAGPWYRGGDHFYGHINRDYDPRFGYNGAFPEHGDYNREGHDWHDFHGTHYSDEGGRYHREEEHSTYVRH